MVPPPAVGVAVPALQLEAGEVDLVVRVSYVGGNVAVYSETDSALNLTVGDQGIGVVYERIGLNGAFNVDGADTMLTSNTDIFVQSNLGGTSVPVTFLGQNQNATAAGTTELSLYSGVGLSAKVSPSAALTAGADAQGHFSGQMSGTARAALVVDF